MSNKVEFFINRVNTLAPDIFSIMLKIFMVIFFIYIVWIVKNIICFVIKKIINCIVNKRQDKEVRKNIVNIWNRIVLWEKESLYIIKERKNIYNFLCGILILTFLMCVSMLICYRIILFRLLKILVKIGLLILFLLLLVIIIRKVRESNYFKKVIETPIKDEIQFVRELSELVKGGNNVMIGNIIKYTKEITPEKLVDILRGFSVPDLNKLIYTLQKDIEQRTIKINWSLILKLIPFIVAVLVPEQYVKGYIGEVNQGDSSSIIVFTAAVLDYLIIWFLCYLYGVLIEDIPITSKYLLYQLEYTVEEKKQKKIDNQEVRLVRFSKIDRRRRKKRI